MTRETQPKGPRISAEAYDLLKQLAAAGAAGIEAWDGRPARPLKTAGYAVEKVIKKVTCLVITAAGKKAFAMLPVGGNKKAAGAKRGAKKSATKKGATKKATKAVRGTAPSGKQTTKLVEKKTAAAPAKAPKVKKPRAKKAAKPEATAPRRRGRKAEAASVEGESVNVTPNATPETPPTE